MGFHEKKFVFAFRATDLEGELTFLDEGRIIVYRDDRGNLTATRNRCKHQSGRFHKGRGCVVTCPNHGWRLDAATMQYVNPRGGLRQEQLLVEEGQGGEFRLFEVVSAPWEFDRRAEAPLTDGEFTIRFYAHACVEIQCGPKRLFTDPWLVGPAFTLGWWLIHQPPSDWLDRLAAADAIYISHNHSDHLNPHTLRLLAARNPDVPVFVPDFEGDPCSHLLRKIGLRNITVLPFGEWRALDDNGRFMILPDAAGRSDSGVLVEYKGHRVLNTVDSHNLCNGALPATDVLLTSFAGGASGYPVCWEGYAEQQRAKLVQHKRQAMLARALDIVKQVRPKTYIPFAGYFTEAYPADSEIQRLNVKNSPQEACQLVLERCPGTATWIPQPGGVLDVGLRQPPPSCGPAQGAAVSYDFDIYVREIQQSREFAPLCSFAGVRQYFRWAGFQGDLVLHVIETSFDFQTVVREFYFDLLTLSFLEHRPSRPHRYLRMRCRAAVFRHVLRYGLPWEEISIGFQARFYREPDVYNFDFWDHFQNKLPKEPPCWEHVR